MTTSARFLAAVFCFLPIEALSSARGCDWPTDMPSSPVVLVGEVHGTRETPEFVGRLACAAASQFGSASVALEIPTSQQPLIDAFINSRGSRADKARLLRGAFWSRRLQDGRSSEAMLALLERLRQLKTRYKGIRVLAIDEPAGGSRDAGMALHIRAEAARPGTRVIALLGNLHASQRRGTSWDPGYEPAGYRLAPLRPLSVRFSGAAGSAWVCAPECGIKIFGSFPGTSAITGYETTDVVETGYHGRFSVPRVQASTPPILPKRRSKAVE